MGFLKSWRHFWTTRAYEREARRLMAALFSRPDLKDISSLRPAHRPRAQLLGYDTKDGKVVRIRFGFIRHPQAMRVRGVFHEVIEIYRYDIEKGTVEVESSHNLTKKGAPIDTLDKDGT